MTETIKIVLASDENYVPHMASLIASILVNSHDDEQFTFYILDGGITEKSQEKVLSLKYLKDFEIQFVTIDLNAFRDCPDIAHFSKNTYSRLLIPELLPQESRVLYLDCDMIVVGSLAELWNQDLKGKSIAWVRDYMDLDPFTIAQKFRIGMENFYLFNAGMLLIDLDKIRQTGRFQDVIRWTEEHKDIIQWADQDGLNVCLVNDRLRVSEKWNHAACSSNTSMESPVIIHYLTHDKPWHIQYSGRFQNEYIKYRNMTPWKNFELETSSPHTLQIKYPKGLRGIKSRMVDYIVRVLLKHSPWLQKLTQQLDLYQARECAFKEILKKYIPIFEENINKEI